MIEWAEETAYCNHEGCERTQHVTVEGDAVHRLVIEGWQIHVNPKAAYPAHYCPDHHRAVGEVAEDDSTSEAPIS